MTESPEFRAQAIKARRLEITATLTEWKRAFFVDGVERSLGERLTLAAEDAALAVEFNAIGAAAVQAKAARRHQLNTSLLANLLALLTERGHDELIAEAQRRADEAAATPTA